MTYIARPNSKAKEKALKAVFEALDIPYEKQENGSPYNPEFVAKIKRGEEAAKQGQGLKINMSNLWK